MPYAFPDLQTRTPARPADRNACPGGQLFSRATLLSFATARRRGRSFAAGCRPGLLALGTRRLLALGGPRGVRVVKVDCQLGDRLFRAWPSPPP